MFARSVTEPVYKLRPVFGGRFGSSGAPREAPKILLRETSCDHRATPYPLDDLLAPTPNPNAAINRLLTKLNDTLDMTLTHDTGLTHQIIGLAFRVHTRVGSGLSESAYELCLCYEFDRNRVAYARQVELPFDYDGVRLACGYRADIMIRDEVLLEIKSVDTSCRCMRRGFKPIPPSVVARSDCC